MTGEALAWQVADGGEKSISMVTLIVGPGVGFLSFVALSSPSPCGEPHRITPAYARPRFAWPYTYFYKIGFR